MWGLPRAGCFPAPISITSESLPLLQTTSIPGEISPRPLVPIGEPDQTPHPPAAAWLFAKQIFANLAIPHPSLSGGASRIMARVLQHLVVGQHTP
jgi:hypothetical protein